MLIAAIITILFHRFKQPVVLGYILAGIIIGPYTPPFMFISDEKIINTLAELGVIFLMFTLGLEFDLHKLRKVGFAAFVAAFAEIIMMICVGYAIGRLFNWSAINSLFLGSILAISSTTIIVKALEDLGMKREKFASLVFGILVIEDIFAIAILALLSTIATTGALTIQDIFLAFAKLATFLLLALLLGLLMVPKILDYVAKFRNKEMLLITALGLCFGFCLIVVKLNYSVALGSFLIGAIIAESKQFRLIERLILPLKDTFSAIFFVSVGLLFDPRIVVDYTLPILIITIAVVFGKILCGSFGMLISGQEGKTAMRVGMSLAQIGEFSFIIASLGIALKVTGNFLYLIAVAVSAITTLLTPHLIKHSDAITNYIGKFLPTGISSTYDRYLNWLVSLKPDEERIGKTKLIQRNFFLVFINLLLVLAFFLIADFVAITSVGVELKKLFGEDIERAIIWSLALIVSMPFLIAIYRKIYALCVSIFEFSDETKKLNNQFREIISVIISTCLIAAIFFLIISITNYILPPIWLLMPILGIFSLLTIISWSWLVKIHYKWQIYFTEVIRKKV